MKKTSPESSPVPGAHPFDGAAGGYDPTLEGNRTLRWMRQDNLERLCRVLPTGHLLEIGAGTGTEAIVLARAGRRITALEPSSEMRRVLAARVREAGLESRIEIRAESTETFGREGRDLPSFDGAYSSLGPLNCCRDLPTFSRDLAAHLRPGAIAVLSIMSRDCFTERMFLGLRGRFSEARRRQPPYPRAVPTAEGAERIETWYWSLRELHQVFSADFRVHRWEPFPLLLPAPSIVGPGRRRQLDGWMRQWHRLALPWERRLRQSGRFAGWGDHIRLEMERLGTDPGIGAEPSRSAEPRSCS